LIGRLILFPPKKNHCGHYSGLRVTDCCLNVEIVIVKVLPANDTSPTSRALIGVTSFDRQIVRVSSFRLPGDWTVAKPNR
jgi:hypothetical protein